MNVLVIASHIDDEVIGCGGTIAKHVEMGDQVYVLYIATRQSVRFDQHILKIRKSHARKVSKSLGITQIFFAELPLIMLDSIPQLDIVTEIEKVIYDIKPEIIYCHFHDDINSDHRIVYESTVVWCRPSKAPFIKKIYLYEVFGSSINFVPNYYVNIDNYIDKKLDALCMYTTEIKAQTRSVETLRAQARYRGAEVNVNYAEAFYLYREVQ